LQKGYIVIEQNKTGKFSQNDSILFSDKKKIIIKFLLIYFIITTALVFLYFLQYKKGIENYLNHKTHQHLLEYRAVYNEYKVLSNIIFDADINTENTINIFQKAYTSSGAQKNIIRKKLLDHLKLKYEKLKRYNLKQLHFHLPDNESFLRMHRPNKYGDNLTNIRATVAYVNRYKKYIDGFEEGRIFNGFRFVYPLFSEEKKHIGSVEISFSVLAMVETMLNTYNLKLNFLIKKDVVDKKLFKDELKNYILSPNKKFYYEKSIYEKYPPLKTKMEDVKDYTQNLMKGKPFTVFEDDLDFIKTMIPIKNPVSNEVVAVLCIYQDDKVILNDKNDLISKIFISYILLALIFYLFYKQTFAKAKLLKLNQELDKRVSLEVRKGRKQDLHMFNQSKMASIGRMITNISHQWRQPLSVITTCASGLKIEKDMNMLESKDFEKFINSILEQSKYLSKTLDSFRDYIDINDEEKKVLCVQSKMDKVVNFLAPFFKENNIEIIKKYEEEKLYILGTTSELFEIFNAILTNANDAFSKNKNVTNKQIVITVKKKNENKIFITIRDNAGGIEKDKINNIFDPYFTTKHESIGTGISLYLTYKIVTENLKGTIYVKNKTEGAKFYIELPLAS
jgi:signal transduction histidine kinase